MASEDFLGLRNRVRWRDGGRGVNARAFCTSCATSAASIFTVSASCLTRSSLGNVRPPARRVVATMEESIETVERVSRRICDASKRNAVPPPPSQSRTVTLRREPNHLHFRPLEIRRRLLRPARGRGGQRGLHANLRRGEGVYVEKHAIRRSRLARGFVRLLLRMGVEGRKVTFYVPHFCKAMRATLRWKSASWVPLGSRTRSPPRAGSIGARRGKVVT